MDLKIEGAIDQGERLKKGKHYEIAAICFGTAALEARQLREPLMEARCYRQEGMCYFLVKKHSQAGRYLGRARRLFHALDLKREEGEVLQELGNLNLRIGGERLDRALDQLHMSAQLLENL